MNVKKTRMKSTMANLETQLINLALRQTRLNRVDKLSTEAN
jgi:hypothetical protein